MLVRFEGVDDRTAAEALQGRELTAAPLGDDVVLDDDELWVHEVVGAEVQDRSGATVGRVVAVDANPDRGTLAERVPGRTPHTVRHVVQQADQISTFAAMSELVTRDASRLDVLASDTDPATAEAFGEQDYRTVADVLARHYSIVLTDCGTGMVHSVMRGTLDLADELVLVSGASVDEARLASETLTWLEARGYGHLVRSAVVALNTATPSASQLDVRELRKHFESRCRVVTQIPYDPHLAEGAAIDLDRLQPDTRQAALELAADVVDGLGEGRD
jgi:MinD-like ATPase involved in chromosome partitioning or flagellar assembly